MTGATVAWAAESDGDAEAGAGAAGPGADADAIGATVDLAGGVAEPVEAEASAGPWLQEHTARHAAKEAAWRRNEKVGPRWGGSGRISLDVQGNDLFMN